MKAFYDRPALDHAGSFLDVTAGRWGWGRDWLWRSVWGRWGRPHGGGGGGAIIVGGVGRGHHHGW